MSRLSEMIKELCPDGVEYKKLGEIAEIIRGNGLQKSDFVDSGVGCIHYGQIYTKYGAFADKTITYVTPELAKTLKTVSTGDLVVAITSENVEDVCKCVAWLGGDDIVTGGHAAIVKHKQNPKYLSYIFQTVEFFRQKRKYVIGTKVIEMSPKKLAEISIPVPPLAIQNEIVKLLDNFTELTAELTAELALLKKQYSFYRDSLLNFSRNDAEIEWRTLGEVSSKICSGGTPSSSNSSYYHGDIPWLRTQEVDWSDIYDTGVKISEEGLSNSSARWIPANCVIIAMYGATAAKAAINRIPLTTNQACCNLEVNESIALHKYVYHWVYSQYENLKAKGQGSQSNINKRTIEGYPIPIPPLETQAKIVSILDRFDALCHDLTQGLPAEIAARKKQYEYYRDKLLTFPRKAV
jgi:type I restriction-modification system specificity determinant